MSVVAASRAAASASATGPGGGVRGGGARVDPPGEDGHVGRLLRRGVGQGRQKPGAHRAEHRCGGGQRQHRHRRGDGVEFGGLPDTGPAEAVDDLGVGAHAKYDGAPRGSVPGRICARRTPRL
ncbi:hypothetical protein KEK_00945 [Mycolicibacterium thermoresistibile ATCC 19527]|uniref:Uncharacterized protein n=1 Tax=Mycolicibacterium thermoresistibile (strain ATCC 19527 / DSM 44167 / CIP 105390 / JCM 6362 / NCTC 10409 / 316) TaxID=1078020 RepID=G7CB47_MYCT3|nr:hypothetical protein KEK_00945 [Mycolicibacterium thermoresistibile ATCC 19527]